LLFGAAGIDFDQWKALTAVLLKLDLLGLLSHLVLQVAVFLDPELPFSRPTQKGRNQTALFGFMTVITIVSVFLEIFSAELYGSLTATLAMFTVILLASGGVDRLTRARVERETRSLEFEG
jgi:hypothetical protein